MNIKETISSNTLFHFTNSAENLLNILTNEFSPRYCLEDLKILATNLNWEKALELAIPMSCFCDIPLSKIKSHISYYGNYGIGLTKEWGIKNGICPITYADKNSSSSRLMQLMLQNLWENKEEDKIKDARTAFVNLIRFFKPYTGDFWRTGGIIENYRFYDEREWRFVPDTGELDLPYCLSKEEFFDDFKRVQANNDIAERCVISFEPKDVRFIIVEKEEQIPSMIESIEKIKGKFDSKTKKTLITRIISKECVMEDL